MGPTRSVSVSDDKLLDLIDQFSRLTLSTDISSVTTPENNHLKFFKTQNRKHFSKTTCVDRILHSFVRDDLSNSATPKQLLCQSAGDVEVKKEPCLQNKERIKYYAVALPEGTERAAGDISDGPLVYTNIKDALLAIKVYKGSRCREFQDKNEAMNYALKVLEKQEKKKVSEDDGPKPATCQELCQLRKCIEKGEEEIVARTIWKNPKMLIGRSDTPSIMQEGSRYNAFHVAAKFNRATIIQLILDVLSNGKVAEVLFPSDPDWMRKKRMQHIIDLYLNTPDKKLGDTPLHFASKFGCIESVRVLLSHPASDQYRKNNDGLTPQDIICSRVPSASEATKKCLSEVFKGMVYITVLRTEKNDVPAIIGKPLPAQFLVKNATNCKMPEKLKDPSYSIRAFAGPMSPKVAEKFYQLLKRPFSPQQKQITAVDQKIISQIRLTDSEKGVERIGRYLAEEMKVEWEEYFPIMNCFTNFASIEGLQLLEGYIKKRQCVECFHFNKSFSEPEEKLVSLVNQYPSHKNPLRHELNVYLNEKENNCCTDKKNNSKQIQNMAISSSECNAKLNNVKKNGDSEENLAKSDGGLADFFTPPSSPVSSECFTTPPTSPPSSPILNQNNIFLEGSNLSRLDVDVLLAIGEFKVSPQQFPNVARWKKLVESKLKSLENDSTQQDIFTPVSSLPVPRLLQNGQSTPRRRLF